MKTNKQTKNSCKIHQMFIHVHGKVHILGAVIGHHFCQYFKQLLFCYILFYFTDEPFIHKNVHIVY